MTWHPVKRIENKHYPIHPNQDDPIVDIRELRPRTKTAACPFSTVPP